MYVATDSEITKAVTLVLYYSSELLYDWGGVRAGGRKGLSQVASVRGMVGWLVVGCMAQ